MFIEKHFPTLQTLIPFFAALIAAIYFNRFIAWVISTISIAICLVLAIYAISLAKKGFFYTFGNWEAAIGIEYRLDFLSHPIIILINTILLFFLFFGKELINITITEFIEKKHQHIFYSLLLFAHVGCYLGVISTNDFFNIYVFIEISFLATYVLMSKSESPKALIGAFDYLVLGTIGTTLILISIGFFLALTGSLNISDVANLLKENFNSKTAITAIVFFLSGAMLKIAFFPMHFWMVRAYSAAPPFILTYLAAISNFLGVYIILRFMHFTIDGDVIQTPLCMILRPTATATIVICSFLALKTNTLKKVVIYSTASQIGYVFLIMTIWNARDLLFQLLILDSINKIALFTIITHIQNKTHDLSFKNFISIENSNLFKILVAFALIFSAGLPLTSMFLVKVKIFDLLISKGLFLEFIVVVLGAVLSLLYHFRMGKVIFFSPRKNGKIQIETKLYGLIAIIIFQIITLLYIKDLAEFTEHTESIILGAKRVTF